MDTVKITLHFYFPTDDEKNWKTVSRIPACPLSQALTYFLDVTTPPCQNLLHKLSQLARQEGHCQRLLTLAKVTSVCLKDYCSVHYCLLK